MINTIIYVTIKKNLFNYFLSGLFLLSFMVFMNDKVMT